VQTWREQRARSLAQSSGLFGAEGLDVDVDELVARPHHPDVQ
jgi:hypothetical protein